VYEGGYRKEDRHLITKSDKADHYDQHAEWSQGLEAVGIGCKVVTKSSGRQPWLAIRSQSAGRLTPA
jgi:hypothetical protein